MIRSTAACALLRKSGVRISIVVAGVLRRSASITLTNWLAPPSGRSSRSTEVTTIWVEAQLGGGDGDMLGLERIDRARHAGLDVAEGAGAGAGVAEDHHRRVLLGPALADIGAGRLLADRGEAQPAHQRLGLHEAGADRRLHPDPVGLALARDAGGVGFAHGAQIAILGRYLPPLPCPA